MEINDTLDALARISWIKKFTVFLLSLDHALENLNSKNATYSACHEAITLCWTWLADRTVSGEQLAYYLDSDEMQNGPLAESNFSENSLEQNSLILILLVVGLFAHRAYTIDGRTQEMSESVCEANEDATEYIVDYIKRTGLLDIFNIHLTTKEHPLLRSTNKTID